MHNHIRLKFAFATFTGSAHLKMVILLFNGALWHRTRMARGTLG
jgi:hypothetical protein